MMEARSIAADSLVSATEEQVSCDLDAEVVVLSLVSGEYFGLNPVAASMWKLLQRPRTVGELRDALLGEYEGVSAEECEAEVLSLLEEMAELELVRVH
ncbi:MAG: PqqD family protein [Gemmatimonadetes bacterium]|nr:PqqD family protein [Gemmatimonadota bacterium]